MSGRESKIELESPDISQSMVEKLSTSTKRRLDFPNNPYGYVYGGKSKNVIKNTPILR